MKIAPLCRKAAFDSVELIRDGMALRNFAFVEHCGWQIVRSVLSRGFAESSVDTTVG